MDVWSDTMIIGICGNGIGAGKSTFAKLLLNNLDNGYILPMAKALKDLATKIGWNGEKDEKGRTLLQLLGTDVCRHCISENYWVDRWQEQARSIPADVFIIDDIRFQNEFEICDKTIFIMRKDIIVSEHESEGIIHPNQCSVVVMNDSSVQNLQEIAAGLGKDIYDGNF